MKGGFRARPRKHNGRRARLNGNDLQTGRNVAALTREIQRYNAKHRQANAQVKDGDQGRRNAATHSTDEKVGLRVPPSALSPEPPACPGLLLLSWASFWDRSSASLEANGDGNGRRWLEIFGRPLVIVRVLVVTVQRGE
jgi:hypothetical protein